MANEVPIATVLVVDDDRGLLRLIQKALQREGFATATAASGNEAIEWVTRHQADLMLLDLKLQDIEGKELVNHLADLHRALPFIIITGQGDERVAVDMMKRGALDYLVKDVNFIEFVPAVVRHALAQVAQQRRLAAAEEALRQSEARFRLMADHAPVLIWMSGTDKLCTWFNRPWRDFTGRTMKQELGNGWKEGIHPNDLNRCLETYTTSFDARKPFAMEYRLRRHDGEWRWMFDSGVSLHNSAGEFTGYIGSCIDISDRKRLEDEVLKISEREQRRIGQDLHDGLGQRLTAIELMCESLRSDLALSQPESEKQAAQLCQFLRETIAQTRSLARGLAPFKVKSGGLEEALTELAQTTSTLGVKCRVKCPSALLLEDNEAAAQLYRIAQEAVNNAVKHGQPGEIVIHLSRRNGTIRLKVTDDGKGLPKTRTQDEGMGLHVMKHRAGTIGAKLEVTSKQGKGVTVTCTLERNE